MKRIALALVFACCTAAAPQAAPQDNTEEERLYFRMNVPGPLGLQMSALSLERDDVSLMHLRGAAEVRIWPAGLPPVPAPQFVNVLRADEVDVNLASGEILVARGNIEIAIEAP